MTKHAIGQGDRKRFSREERKDQIVEILASRWMAFSTHELAKRLKMSRSPHLQGILNEMLEDGEVQAFRSQKPNGMDVRYWYHPSRDEIWSQTRLQGM